MTDPDESRLVAHLAPRMGRDDPIAIQTLTSLRNHPEWQVRAALVSALARTSGFGEDAADILSQHLHVHEDYKVRAAAARAAAGMWERNPQLVLELLQDTNGYVRNSVLESARDLPLAALQELASAVVWDEWVAAPGEARTNAWDILLQATAPAGGVLATDEAYDRALFRLLREGCTGYRTHDSSVSRRLVEHGSASGNALVRREADRYAALVNGTPCEQADAASLRAEFRRLRGRHAVQIALDCTDMDWAVRVARAADRAGVDLVEVGDPLIKRHGVGAVSAIRQAAPSVRVVAEMISTDWGRDQVEQAAFNGADVVLIIGPASQASVGRATARAIALGMILIA